MIAEERLPTLGRRASPPGHILGHAGLLTARALAGFYPLDLPGQCVT